MSDYKIIHDDELMHYGVPGMRWGHRKAQITNVLQRTKRVGSQIGKDIGSAAKNKYNNMSSKGQKRLKRAGRVALAFTPVGITGQLAAHGVKKYAQKHPEKIQNGKNKVNNMKNMSVAQARKYADMWKQSSIGAATKGYRDTKDVYISFNQNPNKYQKAMRKLGGSSFARKAALNSNLSTSQKARMMAESEILRAERKINRARKVAGAAKAVVKR